MRVLILEDDINRIKQFKKKFIDHDVTICYEPKEAIRKLKDSNWDILYLDHDLDDDHVVPGEHTGYEVAEWLSKNIDRCPAEIYVHSLNRYGRKKMIEILPQSVLAPYVWDKPYEKI